MEVSPVRVLSVLKIGTTLFCNLIVTITLLIAVLAAKINDINLELL